MNAPQAEKLGFQAEVSRLLDIVAHSLYSDRAVFLRELVSNASDACDRLRYLALTDPGLLAGESAFRITVAIDRAKGTLCVADNGIGMSREDLIGHLGTIARSGSQQFMQALGDAGEKAAGGGKARTGEVNLIGQFGVGFYAAFMVAEDVVVTSRKAGEIQAWRWRSDGKGEFTIEQAERAERGTEVTLKLREDAKEFLDAERVGAIISRYSDHIALPIEFLEDGSRRRINQGTALWTRPRSDVSAEQYRDFYRHVGHAFDEPWATIHFKAEGVIEYSGLVFIPSVRPFDLFHPDRKQSLKLYVKRVFITDHCAELLPQWLRFLKGVVDSEDLALNISREMLQHNPILAKIRAGLIKRTLDELKKRAGEDQPSYAAFWENFGAVLKEGIYEDGEHRDQLMALARFRSTHGENLVSLGDYVGRMRQGQSAIHYLTADDLQAARRSPQLEGYRAKGVEVLLLTDPIDEFWVPAVSAFEGRSFRSVTRGEADLDAIEDPGAETGPKPETIHAEGIDNLLALMKLTLKDEVKDVRLSRRLTDSAVCLVAEESGIDMRLARLLKQHNRTENLGVRVLEVNGSHPTVAALAKAVSRGGSDAAAEGCRLLLDIARVQEGETPPDPQAFARRLGEALQRGLG